MVYISYWALSLFAQKLMPIKERWRNVGTLTHTPKSFSTFANQSTQMLHHFDFATLALFAFKVAQRNKTSIDQTEKVYAG